VPNIGDKVFVKPAPGHVRVLADPIAPRFLGADGSEEIWTHHLAARLASGEVVLVPVLEPRELAEGEMLEAAPPPAGVREIGPADSAALSPIDAPITPKSSE